VTNKQKNIRRKKRIGKTLYIIFGCSNMTDKTRRGDESRGKERRKKERR
jgi:hypothetical protein